MPEDSMREHVERQSGPLAKSSRSIVDFQFRDVLRRKRLLIRGELPSCNVFDVRKSGNDYAPNNALWRASAE
jgi:hypothetical protein